MASSNTNDINYTLTQVGAWASEALHIPVTSTDSDQLALESHFTAETKPNRGSVWYLAGLGPVLETRRSQGSSNERWLQWQS